jgi:hypothetical protein
MAHPHGCGRSIGDRKECECGIEAIVVRLSGFVQEVTGVDNRVVRLKARVSWKRVRVIEVHASRMVDRGH